MNIDENLSRYSDLLFGTTLTLYVLAMIMFLAALASSRTTAAAPAAAEANVLVKAGGGNDVRIPGPVTDVRTPGKIGPQVRTRSVSASRRWRSRW